MFYSFCALKFKAEVGGWRSDSLVFAILDSTVNNVAASVLIDGSGTFTEEHVFKLRSRPVLGNALLICTRLALVPEEI